MEDEDDSFGNWDDDDESSPMHPGDDGKLIARDVPPSLSPESFWPNDRYAADNLNPCPPAPPQRDGSPDQSDPNTFLDQIMHEVDESCMRWTDDTMDSSAASQDAKISAPNQGGADPNYGDTADNLDTYPPAPPQRDGSHDQSNPRTFLVNEPNESEASPSQGPISSASTVAGSRECGPRLCLTKTSHSEPSLHSAVRATLAKHIFGTYTPLDEKEPRLELASVQVPKVFKSWLKYPETLEVLPRSATYTSNDLREDSYIRDENYQSPEKKRESANGTSPTYLNSTNADLKLVDDPSQSKMIDEGNLVKCCTSWKPKVPDSEVQIYKFFLVRDEIAERIKSLSTKGKTKQEGSLTNNMLGPCLCVALPTKGDPESSRGKRKAADISKDDIQQSIFKYLVENHGFLSEDTSQAKEQDLKRTIEDTVTGFLGDLCSLRGQNPTRWPDYVFEDDFKLPAIHAIFEKSFEQGHMPGVVSEARVMAGDFNAMREIKSVLHYVEIYLQWFQGLDKRIEKLESREAQVAELKRTLDDGASEPAKIWAKKYCIEPRQYQADAIQECKKRNTIVCLPTGKGKTLIAITAIDHFLVEAQDKIALFIVPTRALVDQQAKAIRAYSKALPTGGTKEESFTTGVAELSGQQMDGWTEQDWVDCLRNNKVLVGTPAVFQNALITTRFLDINKLSVAVFDECHAAVGDSPMSEIMRNAVSRMPAEARPRIIGLTASFINGSVSDQTVVRKRNDLCQTLQGTLFVPDVPQGQLRHFKEVKWERSTLPEQDATSIAEEFVAPLLSPLQAVKRVRQPEKILSSASHVLIQLGFSGFRFYMTEGLVIELEAEAKKLAALKGVDFVHQRMKGEALLNQVAEVKQELLDQFQSMTQTGPASVVCEKTKKVEALLELLQTISSSEANGQGIIFCARNCLVHPLKQQCQQLGLRVGAVAGVSHMTDARRRDVLDKFATQQLDLLVATNAVEEGLDIPDCRFVIRFDKFDTTKSHIQGSGRARMEDAVIYYFENEIDAEHQKEQLLDTVARDTDLDLPEEELLADSSQWTIPGKYPYPSVQQSETLSAGQGGLVLFSNCLQIFSEYCGKVMPHAQRDGFWHYSETDPDVLEICRYPSPAGWQDVTRAEVEEYWGDALVDKMVKKKNMTQEKKFLFVVIVKMRERGFLDPHNEPIPHALEHSKSVCKLPAFESGVNIRPKFAQTVPGGAAAGALAVWTDDDYTTKLNLLCQKKFGNAFKLDFNSEALPYSGGFVGTLTITLPPPRPALTYRSPTPYRAPKDAKKCAAKIAFQTLSEPEATSPGGVVDSMVSEPASPAATSRGSVSPISRQEPGTPLEPPFKELLYRNLKGAIAYQTIENPKGVFASVAVMATLNRRVEGQPCKNTKEAEQSAARTAWETLAQDHGWESVSPAFPAGQSLVEDNASAPDSTVSEPASPAAATSLGSVSPTSRQEPGTPPPPGQDFKSLLNLFCQKKGGGWAVKYETTEESRGVFASVAVIAVVNERFTGQKCKNKKEAEQSAARTALETLSPDHGCGRVP